MDGLQFCLLVVSILIDKDKGIVGRNYATNLEQPYFCKNACNPSLKRGKGFGPLRGLVFGYQFFLRYRNAATAITAMTATTAPMMSMVLSSPPSLSSDPDPASAAVPTM